MENLNVLYLGKYLRPLCKELQELLEIPISCNMGQNLLRFNPVIEAYNLQAGRKF